jgi:peptidoglycan/xylan/chitin deacetylase (PgdA/CDA1 family)
LNIFRSPFVLPLIYPQLTWRIPTTAKELYLTFDDGPVSGPTEFVLDTLAKAKIRGTFFCIGDNIEKHPHVFEKIFRQGHVTGNHTFNHLSGWRTALGDYLENVARCESTINAKHSTIGKELHIADPSSSSLRELFRPPYGRITRSQIKALSAYEIVMWDVLTHDYAKSLSPDNCLRGSIGAARPGSIIVFHDSHKAERNMTYVLPRFIDHFMNLGYTFKSLR